MKCPICDHEVYKTYEDYMSHILMEYEWKCDNCGWLEFFVTGYTQERIGRITLNTSYRDWNNHSIRGKLNRKWFTFKRNMYIKLARIMQK